MNAKTIRTAHTTAQALTQVPVGTDKTYILEILDRVGAVSAYTTEASSYIGFINEAGETVAYLAKSGNYITTTTRAADQCLDLPGEPMPDTMESGTGWDIFLGEGKTAGRGAATRTTTDPRVGALCGTCYSHTPAATGICEYCND